MMGREEAFLEEISSQCSSGCQSGWTLYLEHSAGSGQEQCRSLPYQPDVLQRQSESDEEDSMVSDASSGPPPHLLRDDEELQVQGQGVLRQQLRVLFGGDHCYYRSSASGSGSHSTRSSSLGEVKSRKKRRAVVVVERNEAAIPCHGVDDDLDDTASSSAGGDVTDMPSCTFSAKHYCPERPAVHSMAMQGYSMLHHKLN